MTNTTEQQTHQFQSCVMTDTLETSCLGCKFLYSQDSGYSNWTVNETEIRCAKNRNPNLPADEPWDWTTGGGDNWPKTNQSRCDLFAPGARVSLDVEGEVCPADCTDDEEAIESVCAHSGRERNGDKP